MDKKILTVHAHPDDEVSRGGATIAHYTAKGVTAVLVTCTDGAAGEILNPDFGPLPKGTTMAGVRAAELADSARALGYARVRSLGYADSGIDGTAGGANAFAHADPQQAAQRLADLIREENPQVIVGYGTNHTRDPHPDHIRANEVLTRAVALLAAAGATPPEVFHVAFSRRRHQALHEACLDLGVASPYAAGLDHPDPAAFDDEEINTVIPLEFADISGRLSALRCHKSQIAPDSGWFALPAESLHKFFPYDEYIKPGAGPSEHPADDLFASFR